MLITDIENNYQAMRTWYNLSPRVSHSLWANTLLLEYEKKNSRIEFNAFEYDSTSGISHYSVIPQSQDFASMSWFFSWMKDEV